MRDLFIGLMSGTSMDGVDGVLADFSSPTGVNVLAHATEGFEASLRSELFALNTPGDNELHRAWLAGNALMRVYAAVVGQLLTTAGISADQVTAIGAHGQTVRHRPRLYDGTGYTIQLAQPALLAELTRIRVVADFRSRDVAAGGQGAPLAPVFHRAVFGQADDCVGVLNVGGISNLTLLRPDGSFLGFDCGPGNVFMDLWASRHLGTPYDADGAFAARGRAIEPLLQSLLSEPYFREQPPKSTGRDLFDPAWLEHRLAPYGDATPEDIQATLTELTAAACAADARASRPSPSRLIVCGGGALNRHLMQRLQAHLPGVEVISSAEAGLPPLQVEAAAFAWLAKKAVRNEALDLQSTTGARGARVLGGIYPA